MNDVMAQLDDLINRLSSHAASAAADTPPAAPDEIDAALAQPARSTQVRRLNDDPAIQAFRQELADGLIRADAARRFLDVLSRILNHILPA